MTLHPLSQASVFIYSSHGKWAFPPLLWSFPPTATFTSFPIPGCCWACATAPAFSSRLVYLQFHEKLTLTHSSVSGRPTLFPLLIIQFFFFFPWMGVGLSRGLCWSGSGLSVGVPPATQLTLWSVSSQAVWALASGGGTGALLVSTFNANWECYVQAGGVEESKFCLFLVVFPVRCISSISPRFYFRRHTFCFITLAAILESCWMTFTCVLFTYHLSF
jgi:hypothetical protein